MALEVGIVGLPGAGKTTLFNVLTRAGAETHGRNSRSREKVRRWPDVRALMQQSFADE